MLDMGIVAPIAGAVGLFAALIIYLVIAKQSAGTEKMAAIAEEIHLGTMTFLKAEYAKVLVFIAVIGTVVAWVLHWQTGAAFFAGAISAGLAGFIGVKAATKGNVRVTAAAKDRGLPAALALAFNSAAVMGLAGASFGLLALGVIYYFFSFEKEIGAVVTGLAMGASAIALFARVGGGIFTKAADVGSDLVGKIEAGIPEDDPRNPGVIADNVGDNIGEVAGLGADIFESYLAAMVAAIALAATMNPEEVTDVFPGVSKSMLTALPLLLSLIGLGASLLGILCVHMFKGLSPKTAFRLTEFLTWTLFVGTTVFAMINFGYGLELLWAIMVGAGAGFLIAKITGYYTGTRSAKRVAEAAKAGPATNVISGFAVGLESVSLPLFVVALAIWGAYEFAGFYGITIAAVGMLATTGMIMTLNSYGPIADNANGIAQMAQLGPDVGKVTDTLDSLGNSTSAVGKGLAAGAAAATTLSLFVTFKELAKANGAAVDAGDPRVLIGMFLGCVVVLAAAAMTMKSVARAAAEMVSEIRRQFREIPGLLNGTGKPDTARCVELSAQLALREMIAPVLLILAAPIAIGFGLGGAALTGTLIGAMIVSVVLGFALANAGGVWDNAKKYIEAGNLAGSGRGSDAHAAAVIGDTVGDPLKDTTGPSLNVLIKLMAIVAVVIAPYL